VSSIQKRIGRKAVKATARHSVRGLGSKAQRRPLRSATLLTVGSVVGLLTGWFAGRRSAPQS
jgi:hypothetical protein